jgi:hypothetical protein
MGILDKYFDNSAQVESETPADTLPKDEYPAEVINAIVRLAEGTSASNGEPYAFGETSIQLKVLDGPMKNLTTWLRVNLALGEPTGDEAADARYAYFVQKFYDATGFGKKVDSNWHREEKPNPKRPGKMLTVFKGKVIKRDQLLAIARSETEGKALAALLAGCTGIWSLDEKKGTSASSGKEFVNQVLKGVEPLTTENMAKWRGRSATATGAKGGASAPASSIYS